MSGRARHLRDGVLITNRKTDRRQSAKRPIRDRLDDIVRKAIRAKPAGGERQVRMAFLLPATLQGLIASGQHGIGVEVLAKGFVQVTGHSAEQCFALARGFLADVAKERPAFTTMASLMSSAMPDRSYGRHLTVVNGALVVSGGLIEPRVFEP